MNVYIDCSLDGSGGQVTWSERRKLDPKICALKEALRGAGVTVLDFTTKDLPFNPYDKGVEDFIQFADLIVAVSGEHHSIGISSTVIAAMKQFHKPGMDFSLAGRAFDERYLELDVTRYSYGTFEDIVRVVRAYMEMKSSLQLQTA